MTEVNIDIQTMITELYNKLYYRPKTPKKSPRKISMREYFIYCYIRKKAFIKI